MRLAYRGCSSTGRAGAICLVKSKEDAESKNYAPCKECNP